jgi:GAF domain-containing protein/HAMP domain-containing protein
MTTRISSTAKKAIHARNAFRIGMIMLLASLAAGALVYNAALHNNSLLGITCAYTLFVFCGVAGFSVLASWIGLPRWGVRLLIGGLFVWVLVIATLIAGVGVVLAVATVLGTTGIAALTLPPRQTRWTLIASFGVSIGALLLDLYWTGNRIDLPAVYPQIVLPALAVIMLVVYAIFIARQFSNYTLRAKLIITFMAVALVPLGLLAYWNNRTAQASLTAAANRSLYAAASQTAGTLDEFIVSTSSIVRTEAQHPVLKDFLSLPTDQRLGSLQEKEVNELLTIMAQKDSRILSYMLLDNRGQVAATTRTPEVGLNKSGNDYFKVPMVMAQSYVSSFDFSDRTRRGSLYFSYPVRSTQFEPLGVLVARYNTEIFQQVLTENNNLAGPRSFPVLLDENHFRLAHGTQPDLNFKFVVPLPRERMAELRAAHRLPALPDESLFTHLPNLEQHLVQASAQPAQPYYFSDQNVATSTVDQAAVARMHTQPWSVAFFQPQEVFLAPAEEQARNTVLLGLLIAVVVSLVATVISKYLTDPITRLTRIAAKISAGDLTVRAPEEADDEIGRLAATFNSMTAQLQQTLADLEQRVTERTAQLQAAADISRAATAVRNLDELLRLALELIRQRFGFYHASIFLMDEAGEFAVLRESTGEVGALLKARGHRLGVGSHSLVGWVAQNRRPRVAFDVAGDPFHFKNPLLPQTRSELSIPLMVGDQLLGVLNVQSTMLNAFREQDIQVLQTLADQLSIAIQNAELFERTQANLTQVSTLYQQVTSTGWRSFIRQQPHEMVYELEPAGVSDPLGDPSSAPLTMPLRMGEETLGVIELYGWRTSSIGPEEQAVMDTIATQISVALESAALFQETQRRRNREQLINEITYQMRSTLDPTAIVQSSIRELGRALGATEVIVKLQPFPLKGDLSRTQTPLAGERKES